MKLGRLATIAATLITLVAATSASAVTITEFNAASPGKSGFPLDITSGPDGNLWWTEAGTDSGIARMTPNGEHFPLIPDSNKPIYLAVAPSGWASWSDETNYIGFRSPQGQVTTQAIAAIQFFALAMTPQNKLLSSHQKLSDPVKTVVCLYSDDHLQGGSGKCAETDGLTRVTGLAASPAGINWAAYYEENRVRAFDANMKVVHTLDLPTNSGPTGIAIGPEGSAWVAMYAAGAIDRFTPSGTRTRFLLPPGSKPADIVLGPDGAFWITESGTGKIGRMTTSGVLTNEYPVPSDETGQNGITVGPDGNIWFTDPEASLEGKIGRLVPDPVPPGSTGLDTVAPSFVGNPSFAPAAFKVAGKAKARASARGGAPSGSTLKFTLSEAASVTATIARKAPGRKLGRKCVAPGKAKPGAKKCSRYLSKGAISLNGKAGANKVAFTGKLGRKALAPGGYRATLLARDQAGNRSAPKLASFTILR